MPTTFLIVSGLGVVVVGAAVLVVSWLRSGRTGDMGTISPTWIAELRAGDPYDSSR